MKYLKHIFESHKGTINSLRGNAVLPEEIIHELRDICLELQDEGFHVQVENLDTPNYMNYKHAIIYITKKSPFAFNKIKEVVERIVDYMNSMGYKSIYDDYDAEYRVEYCDYLYITFIQKNNHNSIK